MAYKDLRSVFKPNRNSSGGSHTSGSFGGNTTRNTRTATPRDAGANMTRTATPRDAGANMTRTATPRDTGANMTRTATPRDVGAYNTRVSSPRVANTGYAVGGASGGANPPTGYGRGVNPQTTKKKKSGPNR